MESLGLSFWLAVGTLLFTIVAVIELLIGNRSVDALFKDISPERQQVFFLQKR